MMLCAQVLAYDFAIAFGNSQGQFELNTMMPLLAHNALASAELLANGCRMFGLELTELGAALVRTNPMLATALGRVVGYDVAAAVAAAAAATGRAVRDVAAAMTGLPPARLDELLDPAVLAGQRGAPSRLARASDAPAP
jgi:fumarate hydratase class II